MRRSDNTRCGEHALVAALYADFLAYVCQGLGSSSNLLLRVAYMENCTERQSVWGRAQHAAVVVIWCSLLIGCGLWLPFTLGRYTLRVAAPLLPRVPPSAWLYRVVKVLHRTQHGGSGAAAAAAAALRNATQACTAREGCIFLAAGPCWLHL